mgnify:CR=1 FL=1
MSARGRKKRVQWDGQGIRALREHLGLTQQGMAEELGTRQQTISEWGREMYHPRGTSVKLLSIVAERAGFEYQPRAKAHSTHDGGDAAR